MATLKNEDISKAIPPSNITQALFYHFGSFGSSICTVAYE